MNNEPYSQKSIWLYHIFFVVISLVCVILLPKGINDDFIDYIKDIFAIFVGFFVTALTMIYDKLDVTNVPSQEEKDRMPADKRPSAKDILRIKQEHNYVVRFFYSIGFNILFATLTLILLIPFIFWKDFYTLDIFDSCIIKQLSSLSVETILLGGHVALIFLHRLFVIYLIVNVFFYTAYMITSLLQVLISKKKI
ncbi:hypothetical protein [Segatella hominis]|uniref:hypothetical protein n=1 Tax=Segatella hominis TaxID=2518605 RepID=UPI0014301D22|nr:hypothetical protein [Segatella hominis]